jgi:hypothetical protein
MFGKPPPVPTSRPKYSFRSNIRDAELEALRQRGLAKLLNKHFTDTTAKLMVEKAAADAALRDLEARKAATSEFEACGDGELSPFDSLFLSVHQWRNDCRRKERETLLLYQRYVHKFGDTGQIKLPSSGSVSPPPWKDGDEEALSPAMSARLSAPPPSPTPPSLQVPAMKAVIESNLDGYVKSGGTELPSIQTLGKEQTYQGSASKEEMEFRNFYRRQLEGKGVDARASPTEMSERQKTFVGPGAFKTLSDQELQQQQEQADAGAGVGTGDNFLRTIGEDEWKEPEEMMSKKVDDDNDGSVFQWQELDEDDDDMDTIISGLTSVNSQMTREVMQEAGTRIVNFLKQEEDAIKKIMLEEDNATTASFSTYPSEVGSASLQATNQAEQLAKQMETILVEYKTKTEQPTASPTKEPRRLETKNPDEDWMVYYDDTYQREYYHELKTNRTQWQSPAEAGSASPQNTMLSHEEVKPEYAMTEGRSSSRISQYRRKRKARRRRNRMMALAVLTVTSLAGITGVYLHKNPQAAETASNWHFVQVTSSAVHKVVDTELLESILGRASAQFQESIEWVTGQAELKVAIEADARLQAELQMAIETKSRAAAELQARKAAEAKLKAEAALAEERKKAAKIAAKREEMERNITRKALEEAERRDEAERRAATEEEYHRPIGCNVPFAYVVRGKCYQLASKSPIFDLQDLVNSMMQ